MVMVQGSAVISKKCMNVLGVTFDSKLTWGVHVAQAINKAKKSTLCTQIDKKVFY